MIERWKMALAMVWAGFVMEISPHPSQMRPGCWEDYFSAFLNLFLFPLVLLVNIKMCELRRGHCGKNSWEKCCLWSKCWNVQQELYSKKYKSSRLIQNWTAFLVNFLHFWTLNRRKIILQNWQSLRGDSAEFLIINFNFYHVLGLSRWIARCLTFTLTLWWTDFPL